MLDLRHNNSLAKAGFIALALFSQALCAQSPTTPETDRLIAVGKLWTTVKYFHPYLAYRDLDWDKALVDSLPQIRAAKTSDEYARALQSLLEPLQDPSTYVVRETTKVAKAALKLEKRTDGTLVVSQIGSDDTPAEGSRRLAEALTSANNIVFDLRTESNAPDYLSKLMDEVSVEKLLTRRTIDTSAQRTWVHNGLPPMPPFRGSGNYSTAFLTRPGFRLEGDPSALERRTAFILNENSVLPGIGCALWEHGKTKVLAESNHFRFADVTSIVIPMGLGVSANVRLSEPIGTKEIPIVGHDEALIQALAGSDSPQPASTMISQPAAPVPRVDLDYSDMRYPATEYRILAAYKIWAVFHYFFAYRDLMDEDWDDVFASFLPKFIAANDARDYNLVIAEMITHVADSHASIQSQDLIDYFGNAPVGLRLRLIEKKPVITQILDPEAITAGIRVGDIVTKVDGQNITDRFHREERYIAASTPQALGYAVLKCILNGGEGSTASLTIEMASGESKEIHLIRSSTFAAALATQRSGDVIKVLPGNIGYVDLDRLLPDQVDGMFERFRSTPAIIFDMRGNPHGTAWSIAPRLTAHTEVPAAIINGPLTLGPDVSSSELTTTANYFFVQKLPATEKWKYKGKTVMLIDERTISQAEHTGLLFEAANRTEFIGTPSAGANGDVTNFVVPGGITISFSGHDVRHANGGALQRLGLQPYITIEPTIPGIRAGRDEVLDGAIEYLSGGKQKGSMPRIAALRVPN